MTFRFIRNGLREGMESLGSPPARQVPGLDALRTIAIGLVLVTHFVDHYLYSGGARTPLTELRLVRGGWTGVDLFFVLSGFLIGHQVWREVARSGTVRAGRFVMRRGLRIWPLYFGVAGVSAVANLGLPGAPRWPDVTFLSNYFPGGGLIEVSWSLAAEEQFYLLVPLAVAAVALVTARERRVRVLQAGLIAMLFAAPLARALTCYYRMDFWHPDVNETFRKIYFPLHTHGDGLVTGLLLSSPAVTDFCRRTAPRRVLGFGMIAIAAGMLLRLLHPVVFTYTLLAAVFGLPTVGFHAYRDRLPAGLRRVVRWRAFYVVSRLSFGIYLVHRFVFAALIPVLLREFPLGGGSVQLLFCAAVCLGVILLLTSLTYLFIEHPFLAWRDRAAAPMTAVDQPPEAALIS